MTSQTQPNSVQFLREDGKKLEEKRLSSALLTYLLSLQGQHFLGFSEMATASRENTHLLTGQLRKKVSIAFHIFLFKVFDNFLKFSKKLTKTSHFR